MKQGFKLVNVTDQRPHRRTGEMVPRKVHFVGTTLAPGESLNVEAIPGEVESWVADEETGPIQAIPIDLVTGEEIAPAPAPEPARRKEPAKGKDPEAPPPPEKKTDGKAS